MIIADTSVWADHLRHGDDELKTLLNLKQVMTHAFIIGEIAMGYLHKRQALLQELQNLPSAAQVSHEEVLNFIERNALAGIGIGYIDAHLLASARLSHALLWTRDKRLRAAASRLELGFAP